MQPKFDLLHYVQPLDDLINYIFTITDVHTKIIIHGIDYNQISFQKFRYNIIIVNDIREIIILSTHVSSINKIIESISCNKNIKFIHVQIENVQIGWEFMTAANRILFSTCKNIRMMSLFNIRYKDDCDVWILKQIGTNINIQKLCIDHTLNIYDDMSYIANIRDLSITVNTSNIINIGVYLSSTSALQKIILRGLTDDIDIDPVITAISRHQTLTHVYFRSEISESVLEKIILAVNENTMIESLRVDAGHVSDICIANIISILKTSSLKDFWLHPNDISFESRKNLTEMVLLNNKIESFSLNTRYVEYLSDVQYISHVSHVCNLLKSNYVIKYIDIDIYGTHRSAFEYKINKYIARNNKIYNNRRLNNTKCADLNN